MLSLGVISYAAAAAAFAILAAIFLIGWRGRAVGAQIVVATLVAAVWACVIARDYWMDSIVLSAPPAIEWLRFAAWILAIATLARAAGAVRWLVWGAYISIGLAVVLALVVGLGIHAGAGAGWITEVSLAFGILFPILGLVLLENLYRGARSARRTSLKPLFIGLGGIFVFDVFVYSEALMTSAVNANAFAARGFVNALCAPGLALAARRNADWSLDAFVSRQVVFYSTTFVVIGAYLLAMAAGGYLVAVFGGAWGEVAQPVFLVGGGLALAALVASDSARVRLKVFLTKHFYRNKYDYRAEWLRFVNALEIGAHEGETRAAMIRAIAQIVRSKSGALWVCVDEDKRLLFAANWSESGEDFGAVASIDASSELVEFLERRQWIVDLREYRVAPHAYENVRLPESIAVRQDLALLIPLIHNGRLVGLMGLRPPETPFEMNFEDRDLLKTVGRHVGTHIAQLESDRRLTESRQFEAYSRLTAFMMHDLKNLIAQLSLVVSNAEIHRRNPAFVDDAIDTIKNSTDRMTRLMEQLQRGEPRLSSRTIGVLGLLEKVIERTKSRSPVPTLECAAGDVQVTVDADRLMTSIEHLVRNGQDATSPSGNVSIRLARDGDRAVIQVADDGAGMSAEFVRDRLFRPFDSTKGAKGMGIGAYQVRDYVRSLDGDVSVSSSIGAGTIFAITLPVALVDGKS